MSFKVLKSYMKIEDRTAVPSKTQNVNKAFKILLKQKDNPETLLSPVYRDVIPYTVTEFGTKKMYRQHQDWESSYALPSVMDTAYNQEFRLVVTNMYSCFQNYDDALKLYNFLTTVNKVKKNDFKIFSVVIPKGSKYFYGLSTGTIWPEEEPLTGQPKTTYESLYGPNTLPATFKVSEFILENDVTPQV